MSSSRIDGLLGCFGVFVFLATAMAFAAPIAFAQSYTIEVQSGGPGTVTPPDAFVVVPAGGSATFTFTPTGCFSIGDVMVDDVSVGVGITQYTFTNVQSDHVLYVPFGPHVTTTALDVRPAVGQCAVPETLTVTVANSDGGQVQFFNGATLLGTRTLVSGTATYIVTSGLVTGSYTFSANYLGSSCSDPSSSPAVAYDVADTGPTPVTLDLTLSSIDVPLHGSVNAITTLRFGGSIASQSGSVSYYDGATLLATVSMVGGRSSLLGLQMHTPGERVLTAVAQLNMCVPTVASAPVIVTVGDTRIRTSMTLTLLQTQIEAGGFVSLRAVLSPGGSGSIHFLDVTSGSVEVGTGALVSGVATFNYWPPVSEPNRTLRASFDGDINYKGCTSNQAGLQLRARTPTGFLWGTDGPVNSIVSDGSSIYIGGAFTRVGPNTGSCVALDASTGSIQQPFPQVVGTVRAVAPDGSGGWYLGGSFSAVSGQTRNGLAHVDAAGNLTSWNPNANTGTQGQGVCALAVSGGTVYAGGDFTRVGGQTHNYIVALDAATGAVTAWNPDANSHVFSLAVSGSTLYVGGQFSSIGGQPRFHLAAFDVTTGAATAWHPAADDHVNALVVSGGTVYAAGSFTLIAGLPRNRIAALDAATGAATAWSPSVWNDWDFSSDWGYVTALAVSGGTVYVGGHFTQVGGQQRSRIAAIDSASGAATAWNPSANHSSEVFALAVSGGTVYAGGTFTSIGGQPRSSMAALDATTGAATAWTANANEYEPVYALAASGSTIYAGGTFTSIGMQPRSNIAALDATTGAATAWDPNASGPVSALALSGGTVYVGGQFMSIGGQPRNNIAALDATTGAATGWDPNANNTIDALAVNGGTVYAGGQFTSIGGQPRSDIAALDATTGAATPWNPSANNTVYALAVSESTIYAGGDFTNIGGQARGHVAALNATIGAATAWTSNTDSTVYCLAVSGSTVYAGGKFINIGGKPRSRIAALDAATGATTAWNPDANFTVDALAVSGVLVYAGGYFGSIGGQSRIGLAALDAATGTATAWGPDTDNPVFALAASGGMIYAGGYFAFIGGQYHSHIAAITPLAIPLAVSTSQPVATVQSELTFLGPNPTASGTQMRYAVARAGRVRLEVLDVSGRVEETLVDRIQTPGSYVVSWNGAGRHGRTSPGVYFVRFAAPDRVTTSKFAIIH